MRLTRQSEIAVAILAACARRPGVHVHTSIAATEAGATKGHTAKVVNLLVHAGLLATSRGRHGGLTLAMPADEIALGDVLRSTQPELTEVAIHKTGRAHPARANLDAILDAARLPFIHLMDRFTVADLVTKPAIGRLACFDCRLINPARQTTPDAPHYPCGERSQSYVLPPHG